MIRDQIIKSIELVTAKRGVDVEYHRKRRSVTLRIVPVAIEARSDSMPSDGGFIEKISHRFLVKRENLFFGPRSPFLPQPGDTFELNNRRFRVCICQGDTAAWKDGDVYNVSVEFYAEVIANA